jgi:hypothetical protein
MKIGTKSVLFGAHCFLLHPWFVAAGWWKLYGFPWDPRLWVAFFVHDLGYIGKPNMDGHEGETHPLFGARILSRLFDRAQRQDLVWLLGASRTYHLPGDLIDLLDGSALTFFWDPFGTPIGRWGQFALLHSRYFAKTLGLQPSRLCIADKLAIALTPAWLYLPMVRATGEIAEYMAHAQHRLVGNQQISDEEKRRLTSGNQRAWYAGVQSYCRRWALEHVDGKIDTWTSDARNRATVNADGVWK